MKGTALLINDDQIVTVLENIGHEVYEEMKHQKPKEHVHCEINKKKVEFGPITKIVWLEDNVDWQYGY